MIKKILCFPFELIMGLSGVLGLGVIIMALGLGWNFNSDLITPNISLTKEQITKTQIDLLKGGVQMIQVIIDKKEKMITPPKEDKQEEHKEGKESDFSETKIHVVETPEEAPDPENIPTKSGFKPL